LILFVKIIRTIHKYSTIKAGGEELGTTPLKPFPINIATIPIPSPGLKFQVRKKEEKNQKSKIKNQKQKMDLDDHGDEEPQGTLLGPEARTAIVGGLETTAPGEFIPFFRRSHGRVDDPASDRVLPLLDLHGVRRCKVLAGAAEALAESLCAMLGSARRSASAASSATSSASASAASGASGAASGATSSAASTASGAAAAAAATAAGAAGSST
jgi:hypothetical protein